MSDNGVSSLLVLDGERLAGILTDRDLRTRVLAAGVDPGVAVSEVMTADPVTGERRLARLRGAPATWWGGTSTTCRSSTDGSAPWAS